MNKSKLTDDINENLKHTMKKIDELDNEKDSINDFTENQSSQTNFFKSSKFTISKNKFPQNSYESQAKMTGFKNSTYNQHSESFHNSRVGFNKRTINNNSSNYAENNTGFKVYSQNILNNLDNLYNDINKDFAEIENFIQNSLQQ